METEITQALTALHKHAWIPTLPAGEEELLGQGEHETLPATALYVPVNRRQASRAISKCDLLGRRPEVEESSRRSARAHTQTLSLTHTNTHKHTADITLP